MRIPIREQLGLLVLICSLLSLMVLALATWFQSRDFITNIRLSGLSLTASLKAAQLSATVLLYESQTKSVASRVLIQSALERYRNGNLQPDFVQVVQDDLAGALANQAILVQTVIFPSFDDGNATARHGLVNVTSNAALNIALPYKYPNGTAYTLGHPGLGYPPDLYPNLTYHGQPNDTDYYVSVAGRVLTPASVLVLGPMILDENTALLSATTAIVSNTRINDVLGWLSVVVNASMLFEVRNSKEGLDRTGGVLIIGPSGGDNKFPFDIRALDTSDALQSSPVRFVLPPSGNTTVKARHSERAEPARAVMPFIAHTFSALVSAWTSDTKKINNAGALLDTRNEQGVRVAVGFAQIETELVDWVLVVEQDHSETVEPINHLRDIVLICVFSVTGGLLLLTFPLAHYSVAPIRQLRAAARKTVEPYMPDDNHSSFSAVSSRIDGGIDDDDDDQYEAVEVKKEGLFAAVTKWATNASLPKSKARTPNARRAFGIPSKVPERRHLIHDELTDLTSKFNEMSDELTMQYERLEERVKERTAELEKAKIAAEAANKSKTLFIANISHELKTPLNGILGLTQICMGEDDPAKIKSTLNTIYKSGDLLLHLLTDILTFSKNEVGQQLSIDEAEFKLSDLSTQLIPTFDRQAKEAQIDLQLLFSGTNDALGNQDTPEEKAYGPLGTGRVKDMLLWGDKNRILQVLMNFTSNSLKFTPPGGAVTIRVRCLGIAAPQIRSRAGSGRSSRRSRQSKQSSLSSQKHVKASDISLIGGSESDNEKRSGNRRRLKHSNSDSEDNKKSVQKKRPGDAKVSINVAGGTTQINRIVSRRRSRSPPPLNTKELEFEFEVEDTGPGIPEEQQKKIFEPFIQGDLGLSKKYGGTGLGLSICAQLASLMAGELSLDSTVGQGSKFSMRIPLRYISDRSESLDIEIFNGTHHHFSEKTALQPNISGTDKDPLHAFVDVPRVLGLSQPFVTKEVRPTVPQHTVSGDLHLMKKAESEAASHGGKVRVLVAEDNKINQEVVLRMLKLEDVYDVTIAKDGQEAYDKVRESMEKGERFQLVFMDIQMPNVDGIQSTKMIRGMGFDAPIVALTAFAEKSNEEECMASGMDYFLAKPIRRPALKQVLKKYCATIPEEEDNDDNISPGTLQTKPLARQTLSKGIAEKQNSSGSDTSAQPTVGSATSEEEEAKRRASTTQEKGQTL